VFWSWPLTGPMWDHVVMGCWLYPCGTRPLGEGGRKAGNCLGLRTVTPKAGWVQSGPGVSYFFIFIFFLFICEYSVWVISPPLESVILEAALGKIPNPKV
jgi:hypothetical protein